VKDHCPCQASVQQTQENLEAYPAGHLETLHWHHWLAMLASELLCDVVPVLKHLLDLALVVHCNQQPVTR
jgi:hypothetical protein